MTAPGRRLYYFDMLKGLAIFLVVMGHVLTMCIREIDRAFLFKFIGQVHMPLFFFISGYFTYKYIGEETFIVPSFWKRFRRLVIPGVICGLIWMIYFPHSGLHSPLDMSWSGMWLSQYKNGYWFTITLFEILLLYGAVSVLLSRLKSTMVQILIVVAVWFLLITVGESNVGSALYNLLSMELVTAFFPAFMAGVFARKFSGWFQRTVSRPQVYTVALIVSGILIYGLSYPWEFPMIHRLVFMISAPLLHIALAVVGIALVKPWSEFAYSSDASSFQRRFASLWTYIGNRSLSVYLLHYFFLFPMPFLQDPLRATGLDFVPTLIVSVVASICIVAVTLLVDRIICRSPYLAEYMLGDTTLNYKKD